MFENLIKQFRENRRLRIGVWLILGILWLYGVLELQDYAVERQKAAEAAARRLARAEAQAREREWPERAEKTRRARVQYEAKLWSGDSPGVALATVQDWLVNSMASQGLARPQITVTLADDGGDAGKAGQKQESDDIGTIRAKIAFDFAPQNYYRLLSLLEKNERRVIVDSCFVRREPMPRVEMTLNAYFRRAVPDAAPAARRP